MRKYLVLTADNIDTDICVSGPYDTKKEARAELKDFFRDFPARQGEWVRGKDAISYYNGDDLFYGVVKPIEL